jgi:hypothetical protein
MRHRIRRSSLTALAVFLLILVGGVLFLHWQNAWVAERVASVVTGNLLSDRGYVLHLEGIEGRPPGDLTLHQVRVSYQGPGHQPFDLLRVERLELSFNLRSLFRGDFESERLELTGVEFRAFPVEAEGWAYPGFDTAGGGRSEVAVDLESVSIAELLVIQESEAGLDSLRLSEAGFRLYRNAAGTALDLLNLQVERRGLPPVRSEGRFFLREGGMITLADVVLALPESHLLLRGNITLADRPELNLNLRAEPGRLRELAAALDAELDTDSYLRGDLKLVGHFDSLGMSGRVSGNLYGYELDGVNCQGLYRDGRLDFESLAGRVNGSAVAGRAEFILPLNGRDFTFAAESSLRNFDLSTFLGQGLSTDFSGDTRLGNPDGDLRVEASLLAGSLDRFPFGAAQGLLALHGDSLIFETLEVQDEGLDVALDGFLRLDADSLDLRLRGSGDSALLAGHFAGDSSLTGHVEIDARFRGSFGAPAMELDGSMADLVYLGSRWGRGDFALRSDSLNRGPTSIHAEGEGFERFGLSFEEFFLDADLAGDSLLIRHGSLTAEQASLSFGGVVDLGLAAPRLELERAWLRWLGQDWLNDRPLPVEIGDSLALGPTTWHSERGSVTLRWNRPGTGPDAIVIDDLDLAQISPWLPEMLGLTGRLSGDLTRDATGGLHCRASLKEIDLGGEPGGEAEFALSWLGGSVKLDSLSWRPGAGRELNLSGGIHGFPDPGAAFDEPALIEPDSLVADLTLRSRNFPIQRITGLWETTRFLSGDLTGDLLLTGPFPSPEIHSSAKLDSCRLGSLSLSRLRWTAHQDASGLRLSELEAVRGASRVDGWARIPLRLDLAPSVAMEDAGALAGELELSIDGRDLLGTNELLAESGGALTGDISLGGSVEDPALLGRLRLRDGLLRFAGWEERLESLDMDAVLRGDTLEILSLHAREGLKWSRLPMGELSGAGWLTVLGPFRYGMGLDFSRATFGTLPFFTGQISGHLDLSTWDEAGVPPHPYLVGEIEVHEGTLNYSFDESGESGGPTTAPVLGYDLKVRAEQNLELVNDEANLELSGELQLSNTPAGQDISGELRTLRGHYLVFGNKFHLVEGFLDFSSAQDINPKIDILAETRNRDDRIQILITNTFAEPVVDVVSEQGYSREDVLRILVGLPVSGEFDMGRDLAGTVVAGRVETELLNRLERMVSGELAGLVDFGLENRNLEETGEMETRWQIGRYLPGGLYISYNQGLSLDSDREVGLEYRLYNRLFLRSEIVNRGGQLADEGLINEYNFDLRLRYEY